MEHCKHFGTKGHSFLITCYLAVKKLQLLCVGCFKLFSKILDACFCHNVFGFFFFFLLNGCEPRAYKLSLSLWLRHKFLGGDYQSCEASWKTLHTWTCVRTCELKPPVKTCALHAGKLCDVISEGCRFPAKNITALDPPGVSTTDSVNQRMALWNFFCWLAGKNLFPDRKSN